MVGRVGAISLVSDHHVQACGAEEVVAILFRQGDDGMDVMHLGEDLPRLPASCRTPLLAWALPLTSAPAQTCLSPSSFEGDLAAYQIMQLYARRTRCPSFRDSSAVLWHPAAVKARVLRAIGERDKKGELIRVCFLSHHGNLVVRWG